MTKYLKYILILFFIFLGYLLISEKGLKQLEKKLPDEDTLISLEKENQKNTIDFSLCNPEDSLKFESIVGITKLTILGLENNFCEVETSTTIGGTTTTNNCAIPESIGKITLIGTNFAEISKYCKIGNIAM